MSMYIVEKLLSHQYSNINIKDNCLNYMEYIKMEHRFIMFD